MEKIVVSCLESRIDENQGVYSRFLLGPFLSGHAVTVATALRRALLSEVKNIAITALHIQGVTHEFSTVVGIRESVLELSLNFQQIILSTQTKPKSVRIGYLHVQGPAIVHANDLKLPDGIECVNPTQYIATLSTEGLLVVKFLIGGKKSFLKSNTSTLNSKKIKEAKAYSAQLSKSLLSHAEYDPPRVFRLLRNQSLPNGAIARRAIEEANLLRAGHRRSSSKQSKGTLGIGQVAFGNLKTGRLARAASMRNPFDKSKVSSVAFGDSPSEPNLVLKEQNLVELGSTKVGLLTGSGKPTQKAERTAATTRSVGQTGLEPDLEVPQLTHQRRDSLLASYGGSRNVVPAIRESAIVIDTDSKVDQSANRISDEFNSEVCLRTIIPLDPIFTPVYQVNFGIERDDLSNQIRERVIMEVWTNGSIHPRQAINEAALSTMSIFSKLRKTFQLDSHSLALCANSTVPATGFANRNVVPGRGSRLHKTKSIVKSGLLNDDATESLGPLSLSALGSLVLTPWGQMSRPSAQFARQLLALCSRLLSFAEQEQGQQKLRSSSCSPYGRARQERGVNYRRFALDKPGAAELDFTRLVAERSSCRLCVAKQNSPEGGRTKLKSFSNFGFVRSRHPVSLFLQNFGKSHIQGQTFLLEQSFGLKARFFKGHCAVLSKAEYTSDDHTFKRTFLPSFKVVLGPLGTNRSCVPSTTKVILPSPTRLKPEQKCAGLTKASLLFQLRFCLASAVFQGLPLAPSCSAKLRTHFATQLLSFAEHERSNCRNGVPVTPKGFSEAKSGLPPLGQFGATHQQEFRSADGVRARRASARRASKSKNRAIGRVSTPTSCPPARFAQLSEAGQVAQQPKPKPILFLIKYRTFSFTRNALRLFGCKQEDSPFLLPLAKQLVRVKMARVFTSCLPLMSKRSEPSLRFRFTATQAITTLEGSDRFDVKQILLSLAQSALGLQNNSCGSETFAERGALAQNQEFRSVNGGSIESIKSSRYENFSGAKGKPVLGRAQPLAEQEGAQQELGSASRDLLVPSELNGFVQASSAADVVSCSCSASCSAKLSTSKKLSKTYSRQLAEPTKEAGITFRLPPKGGKSILSNRSEQIGRRRPVGWQKGGLELRAPQKRIASSIALRAKTPFGRNNVPVTRSATSKLWLRSNRKKQFGFFQFASNGLRTGPQRGFVQASRPRRGLERLGVFVNRTEPLTNRSRADAVRAAKRSWTPPFDFTTFPLTMTTVPPLCLPSGLVTLISSRPLGGQPELRSGHSQEYRRSARSVRVAKAILAHQRRRRLEVGTMFRLAPQGVKSEPAASEVRRCFSAADLFGFNSDTSVRSEFPFQLTTQAGTEFRLSPQGPKRLSILYSSNLDKMSFLSSDLANLSLSLKTYTFLKKKGKKNIASLLEHSPNTLFSLLNGNEKMFHEIERCLLFLGLPFKEQS